MIFTEERIKAELEACIDWQTEDRSTVTTASCLIFAKVIAGMVEAELGSYAERYSWIIDQGDSCQWMNIIRLDPDDYDDLQSAIDAARSSAPQRGGVK